MRREKTQEGKRVDENRPGYGFARPLTSKHKSLKKPSRKIACISLSKRIPQVFDTNLYIGPIDEKNPKDAAENKSCETISHMTSDYWTNYYYEPAYSPYFDSAELPRMETGSQVGYAANISTLQSDYSEDITWRTVSNSFFNFNPEERRSRMMLEHQVCGEKHPELPMMTYKLKNDDFLNSNYTSCCFSRKPGVKRCSEIYRNFDFSMPF
ncbi:MAG: hypothetical protein MHMPM18_000858 [Marteilia pararefringens]